MDFVDLITKLNTHEKCVNYLELRRWGHKSRRWGKIKRPPCPYCASKKTCRHLKRWQCWNCGRSFSVTTGTFFHNTRIKMNIWFLIIYYHLLGLEASQIHLNISIRRQTLDKALKKLSTKSKKYSSVADFDKLLVSLLFKT